MQAKIVYENQKRDEEEAMSEICGPLISGRPAFLEKPKVRCGSEADNASIGEHVR